MPLSPLICKVNHGDIGSMKMTQAYDASAILKLSDRTEYEAWFLEAVYAVANDDLFPDWPDEVIYPLGTLNPKFYNYGRVNCTLGDWRAGFLNVGGPLVFISAFKLLDMLIEWVLEHNGIKPTHKFKQKISDLESNPTFPTCIEPRPWLKERLIGLYRTLDPLRGTIIHHRHFTATDGAVSVASTRGGSVGPDVNISAEQLRTLAITILSTLRYVDGAWSLDDFREKQLRYDLDSLGALHGFPQMHQAQPCWPTVRIYSTCTNPFQIDLVKIHSELTSHRPNNDCLFNLRVLIVEGGIVADAYLFPWCLLAGKGADWWQGLNVEHYRCAIPTDIAPEHLHSDESTL